MLDGKVVRFSRKFKEDEKNEKIQWINQIETIKKKMQECQKGV